MNKRLAVSLVFGIFLLVGLLSYKDFGISWDEKTQYMIGKEAYETVMYGIPPVEDPGRRFHGPFIEFILYSLQRLQTFEHAQQVFFFRHLFGFLLFYLGTFVFYLLGSKLFNNWKLGLLGAVMLFCSPRIFAHSFFNTRDIPTLVLFIVAMYTLFIALDKKHILFTVLHAVICAALISTRLPGLLMLPITGLGFLLNGWKGTQLCRHSIVYLMFCLLCTVLFWPLLWVDPLQNFISAYHNMSTKGAGGFYFGQGISTNPWHWIPVWMFITTPFMYSMFFIVGLYRSAKEHKHGLVSIWFFVPVLLIMCGFGRIFDTWRHVFFVYPAFLLLALEGIRWCHEQTKQYSLRFSKLTGVPALLMFSIGLTSAWMIGNHPMQYVYFSIPSAYAEKNFELDYWGLGFREAIEKILEWEEEFPVPIVYYGGGGVSAINMLSPEQRSKVMFLDIQKAKYVIDNFRDDGYKKTVSEEYRVYSVRVDGMQVVNVYINPHWNPLQHEQLPPPKYTKELIFVFGKDSVDPERVDAAYFTPSMMWVFLEP